MRIKWGYSVDEGTGIVDKKKIELQKPDRMEMVFVKKCAELR
jgi:hypothetical protein